MKPIVLLFDLDGTLLDTVEDLKVAINYALDLHGMSPITSQLTKNFTGQGIARLVWRSLFEAHDIPEDEELHKVVLNDFFAYYRDHSRIHTAPYPGVVEMLADLRAAQVPLAVVSNKKNLALQDLCAYYFPNVFDVVMGEDEERGIRPKPAPDMALAALKHLGVTQETARILYIGDSEIDIQSAAAANLEALICTWGFRTKAHLQAAGATQFVDSVEELHEHLMKLISE